MSDLQTIERVRDYLGLTNDGMVRLTQRLRQRPLPLGELADVGWASPLGQQFSNQIPDYKTPTGFCNVRNLIGTKILISEIASCGVPVTQSRPFSELLRLAPAIKHLREDLANAWVNCPPVSPWPGMKAPYPAMLIFLPVGVTYGRDLKEPKPDSIAAIFVAYVESPNGLVVEWEAYGFDALTINSDRLEASPNALQPCSKIAWGVAALLQQEPVELLVNGGGGRGGAIKKPAERPSPRWIQPPTRYVKNPSSSTASDGPSPAPHWRAAHAHRFWVGPKGRQRLVTKWLPAMWCGAEG